MRGPISSIFSKQFAASHPEFIHHLLEYRDQEPRTLMVRASQIDDMTRPSLPQFSTAAQAAAGEFIQIVSDLSQSNFPITTGIMPWSLTVPWPIESFEYIDGLNQPTAAYYFLKRTYEPTHIVVKLSYLIWGTGENMPVEVAVIQAPPHAVNDLRAEVDIYDTHFMKLWHGGRVAKIMAGPSVNDFQLGEFTVPRTLEDQYFLVVAELSDARGKLVSRSVYWPRCLSLMNDPAFRRKYRASPQPSLVFEYGPWLRQEVASTLTSLKLKLISMKNDGENRSSIKVQVRNTGLVPAFLTSVNIQAATRAFYSTTNYFWLAPQEEQQADLEVRWRDPAVQKNAVVTVRAWNAGIQKLPLWGKSEGRVNRYGRAAPLRESRYGREYP